MTWIARRGGWALAAALAVAVLGIFAGLPAGSASACISVRTGGSDAEPGAGWARSDVVVRGRVSTPRPVRVWFEYGLGLEEGLSRTGGKVVPAGDDRRVRMRVDEYPSQAHFGYRIVARGGEVTVVGALRYDDHLGPKGPPGPTPAVACRTARTGCPTRACSTAAKHRRRLIEATPSA